MRLPLSLCLSLMLGSHLAQEGQLGANAKSGVGADSTPRILTRARTQLLNIPAFSFAGEPICDTLGNIYFEVLVPQHPGFDAGPFLRIDGRGSGHSVYTAPKMSPEATTAGITLQAVAPGGQYYHLQTDFKRYTLFAYGNDGSVKATRPLEVPVNTTPQWFAVADSGVVLVAGFINKIDGVGEPQEPFAAFFGSDGKLSRDLKRSFSNVSIASLSDHPSEGAITAADDGFFYVLRPDKVLVFDQTGHFIRNLAFKKPDPSTFAFRIDVSQGLISIKLVGIRGAKGSSKTVDVRLLVLDAQTGAQRGDYVLDSSINMPVSCFTRKDGYFMYNVKDGKAALETAPLQ